MKLSFALQSKSKSTRKPSDTFNDGTEHQIEDTTKQFVTEFDASKSLIDSKKPKLIIPPKENEWRPEKRLKNLHELSIRSDGSRGLNFEAVSLSIDGPDEKTSYGLILRKAANTEDDGTVEESESQSRPHRPVEIALLDKLKEDLERLPDDQGFAEFDDMPVEKFGAALLGGYGWYEGRGIGKKDKADVKVKQFTKQTDRAGLGYVAPSLDNDKDKVKERDTRKKGNDGDGFSVGIDVRIVTGKHLGSKARIVDRMGAEYLVLRISKSREEVNVSVEDVAHLGSKEDDRFLKGLKESENRDINIEPSKQVETDRRASSRFSKSRKEDEVKVQKKDARVSWLTSHIRVRIISKDLKRGRLYLKKGEIVDVVGPNVCDISMDESKELVQGVKQEYLETALPKRGGSVLVLYGKRRGLCGSLVERDLDNGKGIVRDAESLDMIDVKLDQIAEYIGDPSLLGY